jgi:hypothetical protein
MRLQGRFTTKEQAMPISRYDLHTHIEGPVCGTMYNFMDIMDGWYNDPISRYYGFTPEPPENIDECDHGTCLELIHGVCEICYLEDMELMFELREVSYPTISQDPFFDAAPFPAANRPDPVSPCGLCDSKCVRCDW